MLSLENKLLPTLCFIHQYCDKISFTLFVDKHFIQSTHLPTQCRIKYLKKMAMPIITSLDTAVFVSVPVITKMCVDFISCVSTVF